MDDHLEEEERIREQMKCCCCPENPVLDEWWERTMPKFVQTFFKGFSLGPMIATLFWTLACIYLNSVSQVYTQKIAMEQEVYNVTLPDLGFLIIPMLTGFAYADVTVVCLIAVTVVRFLVTPMRWTFFRRWLMMLGTMFLLRSLTILSTILPNPYHDCKPKVLGNPWLEAFRILIGQLVTCYDVLFSGHTVNLTLCALAWHQYSHLAPIWTPHRLDGFFCGASSTANLIPCTLDKILVWLAAITGYLLILATHFHYLIDVLIAIWLCVGTWKLYHHYIPTIHLRQDLFNRLLFWLERDAMDLNIASGKITPLTPFCCLPISNEPPPPQTESLVLRDEVVEL